MATRQPARPLHPAVRGGFIAVYGVAAVVGCAVFIVRGVQDGFWPRFDADVMQAAIAAVAQVPRWTEWQQVQAPTLLVQAERSYLDAAEIDRMLTLRPGTGHVVVSDAGHDVHRDQPQAWTQLLRHYLDTAKAPSGC